MRKIKFTIPAFHLSNFDWGNSRSGSLLHNGKVVVEGHNISGKTFELNVSTGDTITFKKYFRGRLDNEDSVQITDGLAPNYSFKYA